MIVADDLTNIIDTLILALPAIIAAIYAGRVHRQIQTPSGPSIGKQVERSHLTAIANNMMLSNRTGPTRPLEPESVQEDHETPPLVPDEQPVPPQ